MRWFAPFIAVAVLLVLVVAALIFGRGSSTTGPEVAPTPAPTVAGQEATPVPTASPVVSVAQPSATSQAAPTQSPEKPVAAPSPTATPAPAVVVHPYQYPGNPTKYFGLEISSETTIYAPFSGTVRWIIAGSDKDKRIPEGKELARLGLFAEAGDRSKVTDKSDFSLALGAVGQDVVLLVKDGAQVSKGDPLLRVVGYGPSYFTYLSDPSVTFQVLGYWKDSAGSYLDVDQTKSLAFLQGRSP